MGNSHHKHHHGKVPYLESLERRKAFSPEQMLEMIPLKKTDTILDFGAGTGYFTIPMAKGTEGNVYALDIDATMLDMISKKALDEQLTNIIPSSSIEGLSLASGTIDIIIAFLVLHEIKPLAPLLQEMRSVLKKEGYLICLELEAKENSHKAPRITLEEMEEKMKATGFQVMERFFPTESLYLLVAKKTK